MRSEKQKATSKSILLVMSKAVETSYRQCDDLVEQHDGGHVEVKHKILEENETKHLSVF